MELQPRKALIEFTAFHQLIMWPAVGHLSLIHHHNAVRVDYCGQAMSDDDRGALLHDVGERLSLNETPPSAGFFVAL